MRRNSYSKKSSRKIHTEKHNKKYKGEYYKRSKNLKNHKQDIQLSSFGQLPVYDIAIDRLECNVSCLSHHQL